MRKTVWFALLAFAAMAVTADAREWKDATGKFRIEAELVVVRNGKAVLEKPDGSIISVPVDKLSPADQAFLRDQAADKPTPATPAPAPAGTASAEQVHAVMNKYCYRCHGEDGASEGGFNFAINLEKLAGTYVKARDAHASTLYVRLTATDDSAMPPIGEEPRPTAAEIATIKSWIDGGAPPLATTAKREYVGNDQVVKYILTDLRATRERSRRFMRYFTLTHLYNMGSSEEELQTYRNAFTKLVNSLSWNSEIILPTAIDPAKTILRLDIRELQWDSETWEEVEAANPYFLTMATPDALACYDTAQTKMPYVRIDWFVFAASKPPLYHNILGIPNTDTELELNLRVDARSNIEQEKVARAGFNRSGVSQNNRLIERHQSPYGSYWKSYDFGGNTGRQNLFEHPLGPDGVDEPFKHDGGELIFTLPNGLQGYMLVDNRGKRIDKGPTEIVSDPKQADKTVTNGVSCMSCHYTGVIPKNDEIGPAVRANRKAFEDADDILAIYPEREELNAIYEQDTKRFAAAMAKIGVKSLSRSGEPVSTMAARFEQELDLTTVACEFGITPKEFEQRLNESVAMGRSFGALRTPGGTIKRDVFATMFGKAAVEFRLTIEGGVALGGGFRRPTIKLETEKDEVGPVRQFSNLIWGVSAVAFSPNGEFLAVGKPDETIVMFDVNKATKVANLDRLRGIGRVSICGFTPDGSRLLAAGYSGEIRIWEVSKEGQLKASGQFAGHSKEITSLGISADSRRALSGSQEKKVRCWQIDNGKELATFDGFKGAVKACWIAPNGRTGLATDNETLLHLDLQKFEVTKRTPLTSSWASGQCAAISPDGELIAIGDTYDVRLWEVKTGKELPRLTSNDIQWSAVFTDDGTRLMTGANGQVNVWDVRSQQRIAAVQCGQHHYIKALAASPDNKHAAAEGGATSGHDLSVLRIPDVPK